MKKLIFAALCAMLMAGCNTVSGFGKDVQKAGEAVEKASKK